MECSPWKVKVKDIEGDEGGEIRVKKRVRNWKSKRCHCLTENNK